MTDEEAAIYLITKYFSNQWTKQDERVLGYLLHKLYEDHFPDEDRSHLAQYSSLSPEDRQYLHDLKGRLSEDMEELYRRTLKAYAERSWQKFNLYLDPHFLIDLDPKGGKDGGLQ